jgi:hypothetical protein
MRVVIGWIRASRQDLSKEVGMMSSEQVAFEELRIAERISSGLAGEKFERIGGCEDGGECGETKERDGKLADSLEILSLKNERKEEASCDAEEQTGKEGGADNDSSESNADHSFLD